MVLTRAFVALTVTAALSSACASSAVDEVDGRVPFQSDATATATTWRTLFRSEVAAAPPLAPSYSLRGDGYVVQLVITQPGTLLCPFRIGDAEVTGSILNVAVEAVGPENGDLRRIDCEFDGTIIRDLDSDVQQARTVKHVYFEKDEAIRVEALRRSSHTGARR